MYARTLAMGMVVLAMGLSSPTTEAAPDPAAPFLGEWGIKIQNVDDFSACWLKVFRKDDGGLDMRLLWRWGSVTKVKSVKLEGKELVWVRPEYWEEKEKTVDTTYRARLQRGRLVGSVKMPSGEVQRFAGGPTVDKVDVAGKWIVVADEDPDQIKRTLAIEQKGDKVTGEYDDGEVKADIKSAKLTGNKLAFEISGEGFGVKCDTRVEGDRIRGSYELDGGDSGYFSGTRQRKKGETIVLFDGRSFKGWHSRNPKNKKIKWELKDGYAAPLSGGADIISDRKFRDFIVSVEYRFPKEHGNSGVYVRGRYEVQLFNDHGKGVSNHGAGALYSRVVPTKNVTKPTNEWQKMDITLAGQYITVVHNGEIIVNNAYLEGITGGALDANENAPGPILLQAHGEAVHFKRVELTPLLKE